MPFVTERRWRNGRKRRIANGMEFVNDPAVIGKWKSVGSLEAGEDFPWKS